MILVKKLLMMNPLMFAWRRLVVFSSILLMAGCASNLKVSLDQSRLSPAAMNKGNITGLSLAMVDKEGLLWSGNFGFADKTNQRTPTVKTLYRIGSITKLFTATAIVQLHERGLLNLDDSISKYLPELRVAACFGEPEITIAHLLTHQSGLPHSYEPNFWTGNDWRGVAADVRCEIVPYRAGLIVSYSNIGYTLLGNIIEKVSGEPYQRYVQTHILEPLHIEGESALFELQGELSDARFGERIAHAYDLSGQEMGEPPLRDLPAGGIYASSTALSKFLAYFLRGATGQDKGLFRKQETAMDVLRPHGLENALAMDLKIGWGWFLSRSPDDGPDDIAQHDGSRKFHQGRVILSPQRGIGIVLLANSGSGDELQSLSKRLFTTVASPDKVTAKRTAVKADSHAVDFCVNGKIPGYYSSELGLVKVEPHGRDFTASVNGSKLQLKATESNYFDPSIRLFGFFPLGKGILGDLQISLRCADDLTYAAVKEKNGEFSVAYRVYANKQRQLDDKWLGRYTLLGANKENAYLRVWREDGETMMESEHLPVSVSKNSFLLSALDSRQARVLYLNDQWGPLVNFSDSPQGILANYQGFTFVKGAR
jgi:CubicO group peptidase (beta-lactamase class C family)